MTLPPWMAAPGLFVTGTDTGCGKTEVSLGLMRVLQSRGFRVLGMKPVASGCEPGPGGLRNADALRLQRQGSRQLPYERVNPYAFEPPIAPHLAAAECGAGIDPERVVDGYRSLAAEADRVVVEGVGGWRVPLGPGLDLDGLARRLDLPVILVVGLRLGCLNHSLLSAEAILAGGCRLAGWVANCLDPDMLRLEENLATLEARLPAPCLGRVPHLVTPSPAAVARALEAALNRD